MQLVLDIAAAIRRVVPSTFILGIKLNSVDYISGCLDEQHAHDHLLQLADNFFDFVEVSGGDYESPGLFK